MRVNTSFSIEKGKLEALDALLGPNGNRSRAIEQAIDAYIQRLRREVREQRDQEIYRAHEEDYASEVAETLAFQAEPGRG